MKISEAEKLACPFIQHMCLATGVATFNMTEYSHLNINCITDKCMAWETTKTKAIYDFTCPSCGKEYVNSSLSQELPREDCEGYCRRLK